MRSFHLPLLGLLLATLACSVVLPGPTPTATPLPTAAPPALVPVIFTVRLPANTPPGSVPAVEIFDDVLGVPLATVTLSQVDVLTWTGNWQTYAGTLLKYRYLRQLPSAAAEVTAVGQALPYRVLPVGPTSALAEDYVAAWSDVVFAGNLGRLIGRVWNRNTGQGAMGVLVEAGGQVTLSAYDGAFAFAALPVGAQRITVFSTDGAFRAASVVTNVVAGQTVEVDVTSADPNAVQVTFVLRNARLPDAQAVVRLAGNVTQLGQVDTFVPATRAAPMTLQQDGSWTYTTILYEGTLVRYRYTLGDGAWNGELDAQGQALVRWLTVPWQNTTAVGEITAWQPPQSAPVTFEITVPANTPPNDAVVVQFNSGHWRAPLPMWRVAPNRWRYALYNPVNFSGSVFYRYCRAAACGTADDVSTAGPNAGGHVFTPAVFGQDLRESVDNWQWLDPVAPTSGILPAIQARADFRAGVDLTDAWEPALLPNYVTAFQEMRATGANWVTFTRLGSATMQPTPHYADDPTRAPLPTTDWRTLAQQARFAGLRVALHPTTCHYTPYGNCEYWNNLNTSGGFWEAWFVAYERYLLTQAEIAQQGGAELLIIADYKLRPSFPGEPEAAPDADARWRALIIKLRERYPGLALGAEMLMGEALWPNTPGFFDSVDVIRVAWWSRLRPEAAPTSVAEMSTTAAGLMDNHLRPLAQRFNKPLWLSVTYYSAAGGATHCLKRADGLCHSFEDFYPSSTAATEIPLDLQDQADAYSAVLTALNDRPWLTGFSTFGYAPTVLLRDKSISPRGKPAEAVLSAWYLKLQGK